MFSAVAALISGAIKLRAWLADHGITQGSVVQAVHAGEQLYEQIKLGKQRVFADDGTPLTPFEFEAKFDAWRTAQEDASLNATARIDARHQGDGQ